MQWRADHADAALRAAEVAAYSEPGSGAAAAWSRAAIFAYPLDGRGYRVLADAAGTRAELGRALHEVAAQRSPRDYLSQAWVINDALRTADFARAVAMLDRMLRVRPEIAHHLTPVLAGIAGEPRAQPALADVLARNPPWRETRFGSIVGAASSGIALSGLMEELKARPGGVRAAEQAAWINRLVADRQYAVAYLAWIESLSADQQQRVDNVFDGGFEQAPTGAAFEWQLRSVPGMKVERVGLEGGSGAVSLRVVFDERSRKFSHVAQVLFLSPGAYRLSGRERMMGVDEGASLSWTIVCAATGKLIGQSPSFSGSHVWQDFVASFVVPEQGCEGQRLALQRREIVSSYVAGVAAFDDLAIERRYESLDGPPIMNGSEPAH